MPELTAPTTRLHRSFLEAIAEFQADTAYKQSWFVRNFDEDARGGDEAAFARYVDRIRGEVREDVALATNWVPTTTLWWFDGEEFLGRIAIRHRLTAALWVEGGHIGYDVRPGARRRGHATAMLGAARPVAAALGIDEALLTCDETNIGSQRVIEGNGGRYIDSIGDKRRYWVPTKQDSEEAAL
jgi:predicted acetyltransferase